jgi:hypothetical protein
VILLAYVVYRVFEGKSAVFREELSWAKRRRYNKKYLYSRLDSYGDIDAKKKKCGFLAVPRTVYVHCTLRRSVPVQIAKPSHTAARVLPKILRNLRKIFRKTCELFLTL